jgi:two-component system response regulator MprA
MKAKQALILVADDDVRTARILLRLLQEDGFLAELAQDGAAAIARLTREPRPDILVTDLQMPYVDGMTVAKYARACRPGLPVFLVTGYPDLVARKQHALDPAPRIFTKPLDYTMLSRELVRSAARERQPGV